MQFGKGQFSVSYISERLGPEPERNPELPYEAGAVAVREDPTCVEKLAQLFPKALPVRIAVRLSTISKGRQRLQEQTVIEFGTSHEIIFGSSLPLEFEDRIRLVNPEHSLDIRATVVAVRYHGGRKAVAARFLGDVENWIVKP